MVSHPTFGVEEEFLLVDPATGEPVARNEAVARHAETQGVELQLELTSCQVETATDVANTTEELRTQLTRLRRIAAKAAETGGARLLAVGLPPTVPHEFPITDKPRYHEIAERFGMIAHEQGICGCHVHVAVPDRDAAIRVGNRLRPWLPLLLAVTANSAVYRNTDTGYASWRSILWQRWPTAGPPPHFESVAEFDAVVQMLQVSGAMLDDGMVYWDVRPSANFPTIEVRVADVPATVAETVLFAALVRGCVMTALEAEQHRSRSAGDIEDGETLAPLCATRTAGRVLEVCARWPRRPCHRPHRKPRVGTRFRPAQRPGRAHPAGAGGGRRLRDGAGRPGPRHKGRQRCDAAAASVAAPPRHSRRTRRGRRRDP